MIDRQTSAPLWFWVAAILAVMWETGGAAAYLMQVTMTPADMANLPAAQRDLYAATPLWVTAAFAVAVWSGVLGAIALLLRRGAARGLFIVSVAAAIVQFGWVFGVAHAHRTIGTSAIPLPAAIIAAGVALVWFAGFAKARDWLR